MISFGYPLVSIHAINTWFYPFVVCAIAILLLSSCLTTCNCPYGSILLFDFILSMLSYAMPIGFCPFHSGHSAHYYGFIVGMLFCPLWLHFVGLFTLIWLLLFHVGCPVWFYYCFSLCGCFDFLLHMYRCICVVLSLITLLITCVYPIPNRWENK